jgi:hypothetical protein
MGNSTTTQYSRTNGLAVTSMIMGILAWVLALTLLCVNFVIVPLFTIATMGIGSVLYICTLAIGCISPLFWLAGAITGYIARNQIKQRGDGGLGMANFGYISSLVGLGITLLGVCIIVVLLLTGSLSTIDFNNL